MILSERIRKRRTELNLTQDELAQMLGYRSRSSINKIEQGINDIPQSKIEDLATALQCSPAYLMGWSETKKQSESIGEYIKRLRYENDLTQEELSDKLGVKLEYIKNWENEKLQSFKGELLEKFLNFFDILPQVIFKIPGVFFFQEQPYLIHLYSNVLNTEGRKKLIEYAEDLADNEKYTL